VLVLNSLQVASYPIAAAALVVSLLTLYSMAKIWAGAFWGEAPASHPAGAQAPAQPDLFTKVALYAPMFLLAGLTLTIGLVTEPFLNLAVRAADQLMNPAPYIQAVLGSRP
jgi:multicomponent Na+:H+ antiporter subunit D